MSAPLAQQVRQRADVVLVAVRQHDGVDVVEAIGEVRPVRQGDVDAGGVGLAQQHAAVDDQQPAVELEHRHVPADLLDAAERDDAQATGGEIGREVHESRAHAFERVTCVRRDVRAHEALARRRHHQDRRRVIVALS